ncbi:MSHA biogenesis protein MshQ [Pseudomonas sp. PDM14]|uniref:DUF6701 domain-containing protein n=1 Tax=Pseudomonas sp. PDM14 TaxID=2769288 RepID=UPI001780424E|nr:DUF6701 domain-containing protein [Pseudomonas sp. PDM14]MBD9483649.1 MSHA biogenesis protein MshQ [Pseudomonas sp. PDM14]
MTQAVFLRLLKWGVAAMGLLLSSNALAVAYTFSSGGFLNPVANNPPPCQGQGAAWSRNGSVFTCTGRVVLAAGDTVVVSTWFFESLGDVTIVANGGFTLAGNSIGTSGKNISLETDYNTITATGTNNINGSVKGGSSSISLTTGTITGSLESASGAITLNGTTVNGTLTSSGANNLTNASVGGITQITSTLVATSSTFGSNVTTSGSASLSAGSVTGTLSSSAPITTTNGTAISGAVTSTNGTVSLGGGSVGGKVTGTNGVTSNNTNITGDVAATSGTINLTGGTINGNISGGCCQITLSGLTLNGNASATNNNLVVSTSTITGNLTSTNTISLASTSVTGNVSAATWGVTITGTGSSKVVGTCTPSLTSPVDLCQAVVVPTCLTDNFNRTDLGSTDWAVTSRNGSFGVPKIINNRLRLTDNSGNVATGATIQRLLPATSNYVQVQFKYYAYNGNGADGVAVIFSDAAVTPQPGGYGGSLGYAQLNGTSGFSGGWLGVALDEFGNFSNPTETRVGGPGARADSVSIRGSGVGTTGYRYLAGTSANLSPSLDVSGATAGPGHTYRITLDSTTNGKTMVSVERNTGSGFTTLISSFDAQAASGQDVLPSNFFMTLTGSTGGSNNVHELDDFQVCATKLNPIGQQIDHFEFTYGANALTCNPQPVTIKACLNASCSSLFTDPVSVTLAPSSGWTATPPATLSGGNVINFSGGTGVAQLRSGAGVVTIGAPASAPATKPLSQPVCSTTGCRITYADSGFLVNVPNMIAAKPVNGTIQAVRKSDSSAICVPGFANVTRTVGFNAAYGNPNTGTKAVVVTGNAAATSVVTTTTSGQTTATTDVTLDFDANGRAPITVRYDDAGSMALNARYVDGSANSGDAGLSILGAGTFISRPFGLCLETNTSAACTADGAACPLFPAGALTPASPGSVRAGDDFDLQVRAVAWGGSDTQSRTAENLCTNITTPNYRQGDSATIQTTGIALSSTVQGLGSGALNGDLKAPRYVHDNSQVSITQSMSEVGVFKITATPPSYQGLKMDGSGSGIDAISAVSDSGRVGRFAPAYLDVEVNASLAPTCTPAPSGQTAFTYQDQPMGFTAASRLYVVGKNRQGGTTRNYDSSVLWRFSQPLAHTFLSATGQSALDRSVLKATPMVSCTATDAPSLCMPARVAGVRDFEAEASDASPWDGKRGYVFKDTPAYLRVDTPQSSDAEFEAKLKLSIAKTQLTEASGADGAFYSLDKGATAADYYSATALEGSKVRLGRLRTENGAASDLSDSSGNAPRVVLPVVLEQWSGAVFVKAVDGCTQVTSTLESYSGNLTQAALLDSVSESSLTTQRVTVSPVAGNGGKLNGSVVVRHGINLINAPGVPAVWLCSSRTAASEVGLGGVCSYTSADGALAKEQATFGLYQGSPPLIFRREVYR